MGAPTSPKNSPGSRGGRSREGPNRIFSRSRPKPRGRGDASLPPRSPAPSCGRGWRDPRSSRPHSSFSPRVFSSHKSRRANRGRGIFFLLPSRTAAEPNSWLLESRLLPEDGRSEYRVQYTQAGQSMGWFPALEPAWELSESELTDSSAPLSPLAFRAASSAAGSPPFLAAPCRARAAGPPSPRPGDPPPPPPPPHPPPGTGAPGAGAATAGLLLLSAPGLRGSPAVPPASFLRPNSGLRMLSMKKLVMR